MLNIAIVLFAVAAVIGAAMGVAHARGQTPPGVVSAVLHGLFAASGLVVLLLAVMTEGAGGAVAFSLAVFVLAALGGFVLLSYHLRGRALPSGLMAGHGLLAATAFVILLVAVLVMSIR